MTAVFLFIFNSDGWQRLAKHGRGPCAMSIMGLLHLHNQKTRAQLLRSVLQFSWVLLSLYSVILSFKLLVEKTRQSFPKNSIRCASRESDHFWSWHRSRKGQREDYTAAEHLLQEMWMKVFIPKTCYSTMPKTCLTHRQRVGLYLPLLLITCDYDNIVLQLFYKLKKKTML